MSHTSDGQRAFVWVPEEFRAAYPTIEECRRCLRDAGVLFGINEEVLRTLVEMKVCGKKVEVARGVAAVPGKAGSIEVLVDLQGKGRPRELDDGSVDHRDISYVVNVARNTPLAKRIPPDPGIPGTSVFGATVKPPPVEDAAIDAGKGTCFAKDDPDLLVADTDGALFVGRDGYIEVRTSKVIGHDIDYSTGNISFSGDLTIQGTVRGGFCVECTGDLVVEGGVENAVLTCGGILEIRGVAAGAKEALLACEDEMRVRQIERFRARAARVVVKESALHCSIEARESVRAKHLVGGTVKAGIGITVGTAGNAAETITHLQVAGTQDLEHQRYLKLKEMTVLANSVGELKQEMFSLVRDEMDGAGTLPSSSETRLEEKKQLYETRVAEFSQQGAAIESIEQAIREFPDTFIEATMIHPGTIVQFGSYTKKIEQAAHNVRIAMTDSGLAFDKR